MAPIIVDGPFTGGNIELDCSKTSQYLTSLLITCPLSKGDTVIKARDLVEKPYIDMTLRWLSDLGVEIHADGDTFSISGRQRIAPFDKQIPADYSSATFFMLAAAITSSEILIKGLDKDDTQGDKAVIDMFCQMGAKAKWLDEGLLFSGGELCAADLDLSDTPDALPALAVAACFAQGESRLYNVAQARLKETDRIAVMQSELSKLGASISETPDGLIIKGSKLNTGVTVDGHGDHRVIMALATAGLALDGETVVNDAEAVDVTFPAFVSLMDEIGAGIVVES